MSTPAPPPRRRRRNPFLALAYRAYRAMPVGVRLFLVRRVTPSFHVGAMCVIARADGALLLVQNPYRDGWGFPGGLLKRHESVFDAVRREVREEVGIDVVLDPDPKVVVEPFHRRVDVIFTGRPASLAEEGVPDPTSSEIDDARWFSPTELPDLQDEAVTALIQLGRALRRPLGRDPRSGGERPDGPGPGRRPA